MNIDELLQLVIGLLCVIVGVAIGAALIEYSYVTDVIQGRVSVKSGQYLPPVTFACEVLK